MQKVTLSKKYQKIENESLVISAQRGLFTLPLGNISGLEYHSVCEIGICRQGNGFWFTEEGAHAISEGDIMFAPPHTLHYSRSIQEPCLCEFIFFHEKRLLSENGVALFPKLSEDVFAYPVVFRKNRHEHLHFLLTHFFDAANNPNTSEEHNVNAAALWYSLFLLELQSSDRCDKRADTRHPLLPAIEKIMLNFSESLTLEELAASCSMTRNWFIRRFKSEYGTTPMRYLTNFRVDVAAQMLSESDARITDICTFVGYNAQSELLRNFKQRYGISPAEYRKRALVR